MHRLATIHSVQTDDRQQTDDDGRNATLYTNSATVSTIG